LGRAAAPPAPNFLNYAGAMDDWLQDWQAWAALSVALGVAELFSLT
jgi:hypothetical protein